MGNTPPRLLQNGNRLAARVDEARAVAERTTELLARIDQMCPPPKSSGGTP